MRYDPTFSPNLLSISDAFCAKETDVSKLVSPSGPKISPTICFDYFSGMPTLFLAGVLDFPPNAGCKG